ncbi:MAG: 3-deoxy-D-manno-octulosonic acid transferase [Planctomycetaceae bacterium]
MPWYLWWNFCYACLIVIVSPVLIYRVLVHGKYRSGWSQKLRGMLPQLTDDRPTLWLHAVSVGEVLQLEPVIGELRKSLPDWRFVITTTTTTGLQVARQKYPDDIVCFAPLDFSWSIRRALQRIKPSAIMLVELEIWPNLLAIAELHDIPVLLINGRVSANSYRNYRRVRPLISKTFGRLRLAAAQNAEYAERLFDLGVPRKRLHVTGSIKFDRCDNERFAPLTRELRECFGIRPGETVFIAGSTQHPEEKIALTTYLELLPRYPSLRLILVPRHRERFEEVARMVEQHNVPLIRRSSPPHVDMQRATGVPPIGLLDTLGELSACWGLADIAFVGGSLTHRGGQNMIEPASYGAAILFGPHTHNFKDVVEMLLAHQAAKVVWDEGDLRQAMGQLLEEPALAREMGARAKELVHKQQGATSRTLELILPICCDSQKNRGGGDCFSERKPLLSNRAA